ncbi:MAG: CPBP family intramembrane metalloprotease [Phycisphaeraceae bacterium]|nr:CPBP family intramembrane metalloprotease [Phycisphaeraceae bacterium]
MNLSRVRTIYVKELVDILRDRRTLIATIVVPVVLYPLLMIFSLQAVTSQTRRVAAETVAIGVRSEADRDTLMRWLELERQFLADPTRSKEDDEDRKPPQPLADHVQVSVMDHLEQAVRSKEIACAVIVEDAGKNDDSLTDQTKFMLLFQPQDLRSQSAANRLGDALDRAARHRIHQRLGQLHVDPEILHPLQWKQVALTSSGSILGLILPLVLILMTITSAIYPAIDLTAGEHERGTLETLIVCPVPIAELIVGKFLTVTTVALMGASLNLASVAATVHFGGIGSLLNHAANANGGTSGGGGAFGGMPWWTLPVILLSLLPFSVLMSAILVAVCGCARSFKEAQNYVTPVIIAVMMPGLAASMPGVKLEGFMIVMPVGNMVLLVRELLSGSAISAGVVLGVLASTTLYAAAAVGVAAQIFGQEAVLFADNVSLRALLNRRMFRPRPWPAAALVVLYVALLFPLWFYVQSAIQQYFGDDFVGVLSWTSVMMPPLFVLLPAALLGYWKIDLRHVFALRLPRARDVVAASLLGLVMWIIAQEVFVLQQYVMPMPEELAKAELPLVDAMKQHSLPLVLLWIAIVPAVCEELLFRGLLLSGFQARGRRGVAIILTAAAFGLFHFLLAKFAITFLLGAALAWLCWQSRSILPGILAHAINNAIAVIGVRQPSWKAALGVGAEDADHLPVTLLLIAAAVVVLAWTLTRRRAAT